MSCSFPYLPRFCHQAATVLNGRQSSKRWAQRCGSSGRQRAGGTAPDVGSVEGPVAQVRTVEQITKFPPDSDSCWMFLGDRFVWGKIFILWRVFSLYGGFFYQCFLTTLMTVISWEHLGRKPCCFPWNRKLLSRFELFPDVKFIGELLGLLLTKNLRVLGLNASSQEFFLVRCRQRKYGDNISCNSDLFNILKQD